MWQSVRSITKYNQSRSNPTSTDPSLPEQLNTFFTHFEDSFISNRALDSDGQLYLSIKPNGPDGIAAHVLAIDEQVDVAFTGIFNLSLQ